MAEDVKPLNRRDWRIQVAGVEFKDLDCDFEITKSVKKEPNKCRLTIFNLSESHRKHIESLNIYDPKKKKSGTASKAIKTGKIRVEIYAGYTTSGLDLLFRGDLRHGISERHGPDWVTTIEGEDGGRSFYSQRVAASFPAGTEKINVLRACVDKLGVGQGNISEVEELLRGKTFPAGTVVDGQAAEELRRLVAPHGITWSVQDGSLRWTRVNSGSKMLLKNAVHATPLSMATGLIDRPKRDATGEIVVQTLMIQNVTPGGYILLGSEDYKGLYRVVRCTHRGSTYGPAWGHEIGLLPDPNLELVSG